MHHMLTSSFYPSSCFVRSTLRWLLHHFLIVEWIRKHAQLLPPMYWRNFHVQKHGYSLCNNEEERMEPVLSLWMKWSAYTVAHTSDRFLSVMAMIMSSLVKVMTKLCMILLFGMMLYRFYGSTMCRVPVIFLLQLTQRYVNLDVSRKLLTNMYWLTIIFYTRLGRHGCRQ